MAPGPPRTRFGPPSGALLRPQRGGAFVLGRPDCNPLWFETLRTLASDRGAAAAPFCATGSFRRTLPSGELVSESTTRPKWSIAPAAIQKGARQS